MVELNARVLDCPIAPQCYTLGRAETIKDFFINAMVEMWVEGDGFNGKRPFGDSGWEDDIVLSLVVAGVIPGSVDEDGYLQDAGDADDVVKCALESLRGA